MSNDEHIEARNAGAVGLIVSALALGVCCCVGCEKETKFTEYATTVDLAHIEERLFTIEQQLKQPTPVLPAPADEKRLAELGSAIQMLDKRIFDWSKRITELETKSHSHKECKK